MKEKEISNIMKESVLSPSADFTKKLMAKVHQQQYSVGVCAEDDRRPA